MRKLAGILLLLPCLAAADDKHPAVPLSATARSLMHDKMADHSKQMLGLVRAVVLLDYADSAELGRAIAAEQRFARPLSNDATELNSALPPRFLELQDQLRARGLRLELAARAHDRVALAKSFTAITDTCMTCHAAYLAPR